MKTSLLLAVVAMATAALGSPVVKLDGTYECRWLAPGSSKVERQDPATTPPGQIRRFVVSGTRCALLDMMVGFQGRVKQQKHVVITWYEGPSGKLKKPESITMSMTDRNGVLTLTQRAPIKKQRLVFVRTSKTVPIKLPF